MCTTFAISRMRSLRMARNGGSPQTRMRLGYVGRRGSNAALKLLPRSAAPELCEMEAGPVRRDPHVSGQLGSSIGEIFRFRHKSFFRFPRIPGGASFHFLSRLRTDSWDSSKRSCATAASYGIWRPFPAFREVRQHRRSWRPLFETEWQSSNPSSFLGWEDVSFRVGTWPHLPTLGVSARHPDGFPFDKTELIISVPQGPSTSDRLAAYARHGTGPPPPPRETT